MPPRSLHTFTVLPQLPPRLQTLHKLAYNLWLTWTHEAISLFRRIDTDLWETVDHSPVKMLGIVQQSRLEQLLEDDGFLAHMDRVEEAFDAYMNAPTWFGENFAEQAPRASRSPSLTSAPSSASTRASPSIPAVWVCSRATISRAPPTSACLWSVSG